MARGVTRHGCILELSERVVVLSVTAHTAIPNPGLLVQAAARQFTSSPERMLGAQLYIPPYSVSNIIFSSIRLRNKV